MLKAPQNLTPPIAKQEAYSASHHGYEFSDPWFWLRDQGYPDVKDEAVLSYLKEENAYFESVMASRKGFTETLFEEIKGRVKEDDEGVPWQKGDYDFRWAFAPGAQYRCWYYRPRTNDPFSGEGWQVLLDEAAEADGKEFYKLASLSVSPNGKYLAYSVDDNGSERFTLRVKNMETGELLTDAVEETSGEIVWASDSSSLVFVKVSKEWRPYLVAAHTLGGGEQTLYEEQDTSFFVHIRSTSSGKYLVIRSGDHVTAENQLVPLDNLSAPPVCLSKRRVKHDYYVDHAGQGLFIRSNKDHKNYCIYQADETNPAEGAWKEVLAGADTRYLHGMQVFDDFIAIDDRIDGLDKLYLLKADRSGEYVALPEQACEVSIGHNPEPSQSFVRFTYTSLVTPATVYDYVLESADLITRKEQEIPTGYDKSEYRSERLMVSVRDGVQVPVSIVYHKDWKKGAGAPLHLYGYGAYGLGMSPSFSSARLSLLDRGFAYAIAHIRGGDEMGYGWYEAGKLEQRENTFNDFVDVAKALTEQGYAAVGGISISGGSAGGELMGAVLNQAPDLFKGAVLHVPFVDVLNTMLDGSLPLTPIEWPEWGNPIEDKQAYETIARYCPYSNIAEKDYPPMLITGGLNDPRVTYWEPAKWAAKLRDKKTDDNLLMLKINMGAGHGGKSGRFERLFEVAEEYTFLLMAFDREDK